MLHFNSREIRQMNVEVFCKEVVNGLASALHYFENTQEQMDAWRTTAIWIHESLQQTSSKADNLRVIFEFMLPLSTERPDVTIVGQDYVLVIEAKTGSSESIVEAKKQVHRYAKNLYNYINVGQEKTIIPVLLRTGANEHVVLHNNHAEPSMSRVVDLNPGQLKNAIEQLEGPLSYEDTNTKNWLFYPRPTIVDAARLMFSETTDTNVLTALSSDIELSELTQVCENLIHKAKAERKHFVLAVSGVPGAGKTLIGLKLANSEVVHQLCAGDNTSPPLYLSGNGPLVDVLTEALARDERHRTGCTVQEATDVARAKIRLIHGLTTDKFAVKTHVLVFDEAQRAWTEDWMRTKTKNHSLSSEASEVLQRMESLDWSVVVCLVGTGQQINSGERGMHTWTEAVRDRSAQGHEWTLFGDRSTASLDDADTSEIVDTPQLHLSIVRRAENASMLGDWVGHLIDGDISMAAEVRKKFLLFPLVITRGLDEARSWLRDPNKPHYESIGLLASSKSARLGIYGVDTQSTAGMSHDWTQWYLDRPPNLNSAHNLEVAASEFKCQGLELDRTGVCWSWDFVFNNNQWVTRRINKRYGNWSKNEARREFALNAYRVLLTRARTGMIIWVPTGDSNDLSRNPEEMDFVYETLVAAGCSPL